MEFPPHGPEPCASASSATSAEFIITYFGFLVKKNMKAKKTTTLYNLYLPEIIESIKGI